MIVCDDVRGLGNRTLAKGESVAIISEGERRLLELVSDLQFGRVSLVRADVQNGRVVQIEATRRVRV